MLVITGILAALKADAYLEWSWLEVLMLIISYWVFGKIILAVVLLSSWIEAINEK